MVWGGTICQTWVSCELISVPWLSKVTRGDNITVERGASSSQKRCKSYSFEVHSTLQDFALSQCLRWMKNVNFNFIQVVYLWYSYCAFVINLRAPSFPVYRKGTPPIRKINFFRALPKFPLPPLPPIRAICTTFFGRQKRRILQNQVTMITTMMWVIIILIFWWFWC